MAAEPIVEPIIEPIIEPAVAPVLELVPDWVPTPDKLQPYGPAYGHAQWSDVWDWVKEHAILPEGRPVDTPWMTPDQVQQAIDAATGSLLKAMSGFINQAVQLEVDNYNALSNSLDVANGARVSDFNLLIGQTVQANQRLAAIEHQALPAILHELANVDQRAQWYAADAEAKGARWAMDNIFRPIIETIFVDEQAAVLREQQVRADAVKHANDLNTNLAQHVLGEIAPVAALATATAKWVDDCGAPMCDTVGPKTDLGKLLKGLKIAALAAVLAELAGLDEHGLETLLRGLQHLSAGVIDTFTSLFVGGGDTLGSTIARTGV